MLNDFVRMPNPSEMAIIQQRLDVLQTTGGIAEGFHGTSATRAKIIEQDGFTNNMPTLGIFAMDHFRGVWFADATHPAGLMSAHGYGIARAVAEGEMDYAVITARFRNPEIDFTKLNMTEWRTEAGNILHYSVSYYAVPQERHGEVLFNRLSLWQKILVLLGLRPSPQ